MGIQFAVAAVTIAAAIGGAAQRRVPDQTQDGKVPVTIAIRSGADAYDFTGKATCTHAPVASIYDVRAEQWRVDQSEGGKSLALTLWRPGSGADMFTLSLSPGAKRHSVDTVKVGAKGTPQGSGTVTLAPEGTGGTFTISAVAADGARISGTVKCGAFTAAIAEGGH
jgi:hypothetical protein